MRLALSLAVLAVLAGPAVADDSIADQAEKAYRIFAGGLSQPDFGAARFGIPTLLNVGGKWVNLNGPAPGTGVETYGSDTEAFCKTQAALTLASPDSITLTITAQPGEASFTQVYTLVAGATFSLYTDPGPYFAAIGLGPERRGEQFDQQRAVALSLANGMVQIYRPSPDILVVTRDLGYPNVLARCPSS